MEILDVAVIGYGPVGAVAANLLGRAGLRAAVFETATSVYHLPRAAHFDAEIMRVFQAIGLAEEVKPATTRVRGMHFIAANGEKLFGVDAPEALTEHGWAAGYLFYQPDLERALRAGVERFPEVAVHLGHEVVDLTQHADHVEVKVRDLASGAVRTVAARWVLGCDGARSIARKTSGIELEDLEFDQPWLVVDTMLTRPVDLPTVVHQVCDPARPSTFIPSVGRHRRWEFMLLPGEDAEAMQRPERIFELMAPWVGRDDVEVIRSAVYSFHALIARQWRDRRVLLLGDAAHQMPPFLGQGMCAGIRDAANVVWKIAMEVAGRAGEALLDTYQQERAPHVRGVIELAVSLGRIIQTTDPAVAAARDRGFCEPGSAPLTDGIRLPGLAEGCLWGGAPAGQVLPQVRVRTANGSVAMLDDLLGDGFVVVGHDAVPGLPFVELGAGGVADLDGALEEWIGRYGTAVVRPDRYVFGAVRDGIGEALGLKLSVS